MDKMKGYIERNSRKATTGAPQNSPLLRVMGVLVALLLVLVVIIGLLAPSAEERAASIVALGDTNPSEQSRRLESATEMVLDEVAKVDPELAERERNRRTKVKEDEENRRIAEHAALVDQQVAESESKKLAEARRRAFDPTASELAGFDVAAKYKIEDRLRDPESANYRNVKIYRHPRTDGGFVFCGEVNAKNGFGGMSGYERFVATPIDAVIESMGPSAFQGGWENMCPASRYVESAPWF